MTIRDVAERAGVSPATVSRVLNKPEMVEEETKERVREAMDALNFQPNALARGLSTQRFDTIGLVVPGITDLFFNELYRGIHEASRAHGLKVLLFDSQHSRHQALEGFTFLHQHQVNGIIFTSKLVTEDFDPVLERIGIPVALVLTQSQGRVKLPAFKVDDVRAVFDSVSYLVARGHRRIGMIAGQHEDDITGSLRLEGFLQAHRFYQLPVLEGQVQYGDYRFAGGYQAMMRMLEHMESLRLTAICAASDEMALGAMRCLYDQGYRVPQDLSVIGFDDLSIAQMVTPTLTTVRQPFAEIGARAVEWLVRASGGIQPDNGVCYLGHEIVERESVRSIAT
ncbi:LacI family DNA-binding transcriptional regulator [Alicyclobacillus contaminans]|uniref:LacI family DNA-binding transcriptional regulator n=1 Tax=Alicyclobacillus contaminans TaxID=392016 RepID=UPI001FDEEC4C|nr:LacI family DNA-binding transcriptional regulator [Alicyclobacillus contaminans]